MFRSLALFSNISCPSLLDGRQCELAQCLFTHKLPDPTNSASSPAVADVTPPSPMRVEKRKSGSPDPRLVAILEGAKGGNAKRQKPTPSSDEDDDGGVRLSASHAEIHPNKPVRKTETKGAEQKASPSMQTKPGTAGRIMPESRTTEGTLARSSPTTALAKPRTAKLASSPLKQPIPPSTSRSTSSQPKTPLPSDTRKASSNPSIEGKPLALIPRSIDRAPAPHKIRHNCVKLLHAELERLLPPANTQAAKNAIVQRALDIEVEHATTKAAAYTGSMGRYVMRLKKLSPKEYQAEIAAESAAKELPPPCPTASAPSSELDNAKPPLTTGLTAAEERNRVQSLIHPPSILLQHSYLLAPPTAAEIAASKSSTAASAGWETCARCSTRFRVFPDRTGPDGSLTSNGPCHYHPSKPRPSGPRGSGESSYSCCSTLVSPTATGCTTAPTHVFKPTRSGRLASYWGFAHTPFNPSPPSSPRVIALDAEMCYTTHGMEICRLSAVAFPSGTILIDSLVRPFGEVLDFNTRFSGVTAAQFSSAVPYRPVSYPNLNATNIINPTAPVDTSSPMSLLPSPKAARQALWDVMAGPEAVLIGHGLSNDLEVLRMCHERCVDTVVLFPHKRGGEARNRLKWIVEMKLGRRIQMDDWKEGNGEMAKGHDSVVDARCAGECVRWFIKEGVEREKRKGGGVGTRLQGKDG